MKSKLEQRKANARRQAEMKARRLADGKVRRAYYASKEKHEEIKLMLKDELCI